MLSGEFSQSLDNTVAAVLVEEQGPLEAPVCLYKTVECLTEAGRPSAVEQTVDSGGGSKQRGQRSAENLSEDSGFGEHIGLRRASSSGVFASGAEQEGGGSKPEIDKPVEEWGGAEPNYSHWQSAPDLLDQCVPQCGPEKSVSTTSLVLPSHDEEDSIAPENKALGMSAASTPNLWRELDDGEFELRFGDRLERTRSFKEVTSSTGELRKTRSKGSNIQITTSFINLDVSSSSLTSAGFTGSSSHVSKVHFSPVVSEVSFKERRKEEPRHQQHSAGGGGVRRVVQADAKAGSDSGGGGRVASRLAPAPVPARPAADMDRPAHLSSDNKKTKLGGFFQRFSLRRLSGRDKKKKEKKSAALNGGAAATSVRSEPTPLIEDVQIIPLHGPEDLEQRAAAVEQRPAVAVMEQQQHKQQPKLEQQQLRKVEERKPPLPPTPPRRRDSPPTSGGPSPCSAMPGGPRDGLLETDLDSVDGDDRPPKTRSLLELGGSGARATGQVKSGPGTQRGSQPADRAKSMEFLLDKQAQFSVKVTLLFHYSLPIFLLVLIFFSYHQTNLAYKNTFIALTP